MRCDDAHRDPPSSDLRRSLIAAIAAISIAGYGLSMSYPLFALLLDRMGASGFQIGLNAAAPAVAMLVGGFAMPSVLRRLGLPMLLVLACLTLAATLVLFKPLSGIWPWMALRFVYGLAATAVFYGSELWIVAVAPPARRGLLIGIYALCLSLGFMLGPLSLRYLPIDGWAPFLIAAGATVAAIVPVIAARDAAPKGLGGAPQPPFALLGFFRSDPSVMFAVALFGMIEFGGFALIPVWALSAGMSERFAILLVALVSLGNVLLQLPLGWAADRLNRKAMLGAAALACVAGAALMGLTAEEGWPLMATATLLGGMAVALYTVSLAELGARYSGDALSRGTGAVMLAYGLGALIAPPLMGRAMDAAPPHGLLWVMGAASAAYAALVALRRRGRGR